MAESKKIYMTGVLTPTAGKEDKLEDALLKHAEFVRNNEPGALHYEVTRGTDRESSGVRFVVWEVYKDEASRLAHFDTTAFHDLIKKFEDEKLLGGHIGVYTTESKGGVTNWP